MPHGTRRRPLPHLAAVLALALGAAAFTGGPAPSEEPPSAPDQLLVGYELGSSPNERAQARAGANARFLETVVDGDGDTAEVELVQVSSSERSSAERRFEADPNVTYAEPNWLLTHDAVSNDPYYTQGYLWGMYGDSTTPSNPYGSGAGGAWAAGHTGSEAVYVGIIDEGVQHNHPDLEGNIWTNPIDIVDGVDNDGNGHIDDVHGWDFHYNDNTTYDGKGDDHGTHVAGTVGGVGGNGRGVAGVAWNVRLITAKFLGPNGGYTANAVEALDYLTDLKTDRGLNIVATNNSWGGGGYSQSLVDAITRSGDAGILFVAAAGNGGSDYVGDDTDRYPHYPSSYTNANIISVANITSSGARSTSSNYGATSVDLGAPGSGIYSTMPGGGYGSKSGTSMATPHVTGAVALYAAANPAATAATTKSAVLSEVVSTPSMIGKTVSGGRLDVSTLLNSSVTPPVVGTNSQPVADDLDLVATEDVPAPWSPSVHDSDEDDTLTCAVVSAPAGSAVDAPRDCSAGTFRTAENADGPVSFTYRVTDAAGAWDDGTVNVSVTPVNDPPTAGAISLTVNAGQTVAWSPAADDIDTAPLTCGVGSTGTGTVTVDSCDDASYTAPASGTEDSFTYTVWDGEYSDTGTVSVTVKSKGGGKGGGGGGGKPTGKGSNAKGSGVQE